MGGARSVFCYAAAVSLATHENGEGLPDRSKGDPYAVLRNRDLVLYLAGRFCASIGQQMLTVAVGWELYERTGSALSLGLVGLTQTLPMLLFTLPAGHVADNFERKRVILLAALVMGCASAGLAIVSTLQAHVGWVYLCLFVAGSARTFLWPASSAFLPLLVPRAHFARAVAWSSSTFQLSSVLGPAAGGALIALLGKASVVYAINAATALCFLVLVSLVRKQQPLSTREPMSLRALGSGFRFVFANNIILGAITLDLFAVLLGGATALLPVYAKDILHVGPAELGWLQAALPAGSLVCALILAHIPPLEHAGRTMLWAVAGFGLATVVFGLSSSLWLSLAMLFVCGMTDNVSAVIRHTLVQLLTPDERRGRVSAVNSLFIGTSNELGGFRAGLMAHMVNPVFAVVFGGIGSVVAVVAVALKWPAVRKFGRLE